MVRLIRTSRQDIYIRHVERAESSRGDDDPDDEAGAEEEAEGGDTVDEGPDGSNDYFFKYQYELFSFGAVLGFLHDEQVPADTEYGQDIRRVEEMNEDNSHRQTVEFITKTIQVQEEVDEDDAWDEVLRYADAGVERFDEETDDDLDFVRYVQDASEESWQTRFESEIGTPGDVGTL